MYLLHHQNGTKISSYGTSVSGPTDVCQSPCLGKLEIHPSSDQFLILILTSRASAIKESLKGAWDSANRVQSLVVPLRQKDQSVGPYSHHSLALLPIATAGKSYVLRMCWGFVLNRQVVVIFETYLIFPGFVNCSFCLVGDNSNVHLFPIKPNLNDLWQYTITNICLSNKSS